MCPTPDSQMRTITQALTTPHETQLTAWIHKSLVPSSSLPHQHSDLNRLCHLKALSLLPLPFRILCTGYPSLAMTSWPQRLWESKNVDIETRPMYDLSGWEWSEVKQKIGLNSMKRQDVKCPKWRGRWKHVSYLERCLSNFEIHMNNLEILLKLKIFILFLLESKVLYFYSHFARQKNSRANKV